MRLTIKIIRSMMAIGTGMLVSVPVAISGEGVQAPLVPKKLHDYRIEQANTITFTRGKKITGAVEKPQLNIVLLKESPVYRDLKMAHDFYADLMLPLPFRPLAK